MSANTGASDDDDPEHDLTPPWNNLPELDHARQPVHATGSCNHRRMRFVTDGDPAKDEED